MSSDLRLHCYAETAPGWAPVMHVIALMERLLGAQARDYSTAQPSRWSRLRPLVLRPARRAQAAGDIYVARNPGDIDRILASPGFNAPARFRALWIIDSFWTEYLPKPVGRVLSLFDVVAYTRQGDGDFYRDVCGARALFLGWGTDALDFGVDGGARPWDVLRVGRQPEVWDDDTQTEALCTARGLRFHGRPPFGADPASQQRDLMQDWYAQAKFVVSHSNLAAPAPYTHPSKEYITARWTDALACGAVIAGQQPRSDLGLIDWPGAVLDFPTVDLEANLALLEQAVADWTPAQAHRNRLESLRRLDWRWRIADLAARLELDTPELRAEMARLKAAIAALEAAGGPSGQLPG